MRTRFLLLSSLTLILVLAMLGCSLGRLGTSRITPTPTKTQRALFTATHTPSPTTAPTDTPLPTNTPLPTLPPATDTPVPTEPPPPTEPVPAPTEAPPTEAPLPTETPAPPTDTAAPPTEPPPPAATNTPAPPTETPKPAVDFRVQEIVAFEDGSLSRSGLHNVYVTVVDAGGTPLDGIILEETNNPPLAQITTGNKGPGTTEYTMWAGDYRFRVVGDTSGQAFSSEETHVLSIAFGHAVWDDLIRGEICTDPASCEGLGPIHFSYNVTFQRTW